MKIIFTFLFIFISFKENLLGFNALEFKTYRGPFRGVIFSSSVCEAGNNFIKVKGTHFEVSGQPYYFLGANYWYGANLGAPGKKGDRPRLIRELDQLGKLGVRNLRVMALSEGPDGSPYRILPAAQNSPGIYDEDILKGLDFLLSEMARRKMSAVLTLTNFWPWSGGMAQYLSWSGAGPIPYPPPHPGGSWDLYQKYTARFYSSPPAIRLYNGAVKKLVTRKNTINGKNYSADPVIMAWQLCNEPRGLDNLKDYNAWVDNSASLIKSLDKNHLVTTGSEGFTPYDGAGTDFMESHNGKNIDYATAHVWAQNWGWYDPENPQGYNSAVEKMRGYIQKHVAAATKLGKPLVLEEFGIGRDGGSYDYKAPVKTRDDYYEKVFAEVYKQAADHTPLAGVNFWAWAGEGRPAAPGAIWKKGDAFTGDPPHEKQGWYSVYNTDTTTQKVISVYAGKFKKLK
jgi:mannan endo-1,4-beta-mannosidase